MGAINLDELIEKVKKCEYLLEDELKALCDYVSFALMQRFHQLGNQQLIRGRIILATLDTPGKGNPC